MWNTERIEYFSGIIRIEYYIGVAVFIDLFNDSYGEIDSLLKIRVTLGLNHSDIYEPFFSPLKTKTRLLFPPSGISVIGVYGYELT